MMKKQLSIAIPASVVADTPHLREKTSKMGYIARAAAIFRVNKIIVYADNPKINQKRDLDFVVTLLRYLETPQYLRKRLFELKPELQYVGVLPPLRTPHHPLQGKTRDLHVGDYREGVVLSKTKNGVLVDVGVEKPAFLRSDSLSANQRLSLKISKNAEQFEVQIVDKAEIQIYWGYSVFSETRNLREFLERSEFDLTIATSKIAPSFQDQVGALSSKWHKAKQVLTLFGAPSHGLFEIAKDQGVRLEALVDFVANMISEQGTETVRTEEALVATLAIINEHFEH